MIKIAAIQMCSKNDKRLNFETTYRLIKKAVTEGKAEFICLPECNAFMGLNPSDIIDAAEIISTSHSEYIKSLCDIAKHNSIWLSIGGFPEKNIFDKDKVFNSHFIINPHGNIVGDIYRKIHLFDNPLTGLKESTRTSESQFLIIV